MLAILLGAFGAHRFYLRQWWGIFYLLFFWAWIPGIIALVEGIVFLCSSDEKWDKKYNEGKPGNSDGSASILLVLVFGVMIFVAIIGILAAIAIPAYNDYTQRVKVSSALIEGEQAKQRVEKYLADNQFFPTNNADIALSESSELQHVGSLLVGSDGAITITFSNASGTIAGKTIVLKPRIESDQLLWSCNEGTIESRYRPQKCR